MSARPDLADRSIASRREGRIGRITLNRPHALNALTTEMIQAIIVALELWRHDPAVHLALIESSSERAFCAGGDVRTVREWVAANDWQAVEAYFTLEYALNRIIAHYNKPYVALIDGICMGGGIGLAIHGAVRVVTEHAQLAMPETQLGLFPDIGASYFLPRLRGVFGMFLGITGARIGAGDACWLGMATHYCPRSSLPALIGNLAENGTAALSELEADPPAATLPAIEADVRSVFSQSSIERIVEALERLDQPWATEALRAMRSASPSALRWSFDLLQAGAHRTFEECQRAETLLARRACSHPDFAEGVRANVIDKDRAPRWQTLPA